MRKPKMQNKPLNDLSRLHRSTLIRRGHRPMNDLTGGGSFSDEARADAARLVAERERSPQNSPRLYCRSPKEMG